MVRKRSFPYQTVPFQGILVHFLGTVAQRFFMKSVESAFILNPPNHKGQQFHPKNPKKSPTKSLPLCFKTSTSKKNFAKPIYWSQRTNNLSKKPAEWDSFLMFLKQNSKPEVFQEFQPKIKKHAEQFPSPSEQTQTAKNPTKDQQEKPQFLFPQQKKTHKHVTPPAMFGSQKPLKKPTCLARCLGSSQGLSLLKRWDWKTKTSGILVGHPSGLIGWWFCRLKKTSKKHHHFPKLLTEVFPEGCLFFKKGVCWKKKMRTMSWSRFYIWYGNRHSVKITKKLKDSNSKSWMYRMNLRILRTHRTLYKSFQVPTLLNGKLTFFQLLLPCFLGSITGKDPKTAIHCESTLLQTPET